MSIPEASKGTRPGADLLACEGAPRDLGLDQGRWCRGSLNAAFSEVPAADRIRRRFGRLPEVSARVGRDLRRHFPQQYEAIEGMARGAGIPVAWFIDRLATATSDDSLALAASSEWTSDSGLLACAAPEDAIARRCQPEGGFASVEVIQPWATAPIAGINDGGLAVFARPEPRDSGAATANDACSAPATLFAHDCLARFDQLEGAIDWCLARPAGGAATLLFADASGEVAAVHVRGDERRVTRPADGLIVQTPGHAREAEIAKALRQAAPLLAADLGRFLGMSLVVLDPGKRRLGLLRSATAERWHTPQPS